MSDFALGKSIGNWAWHRGLPHVAVYDSELKPLLNNPEVNASEALKGWNIGWLQADKKELSNAS